jgi:NAD(P)-dependent dehydrogenase (short-subunit alcohol dehydrogenase family)
MKELQGKVSIVTARACGIGRATALADAGADVVINYTSSS